MSRIRIIGIGSPAGDDRAGWWVIDALRGSGVLEQTPHAVEAISLDRPGAQLISHFRGADAVILIDAIKSGGAPGTVHRVDDIARLDDYHGLSSHGFGLASALKLARALDTLPECLIVYGIEIDNDCHDSVPNTAINKAASEVAQRIAGELGAPPGARVSQH